MAVIDFSDPDSALFAQRSRPPPEHCQWCGKPLAAATVYWALRVEIAMHVGCAKEFALAVLYDAQRGEAAVMGQRIEAGIWPALAAAEADPGGSVVALHRHRRR